MRPGLATTTPAPATRPGPRWSRRWPASRAARHGHAFASGMAASDTMIRAALRPGDHLIIPDDAYGGTFRLVDKIGVPWGLTYSTVPLGDLDAVRAALRPETRLIWCETPTNPLLAIADIAGLAELAHGAGAKLLVDNTFASPYLQQPLALGADVVLHSTTKYIGGHSDVIGGALITDDDELGEAFAFHVKSMGAIAGPFDAWLTLRGVQDPGPADGSALRQCRGGRRSARRASQGRPGLLPGSAGTSGSSGRCRADAAVRRDGVVHRRRRPGGGAQGLRAHPAVHPRRVARRGGVADRASRADDPRQRRRVASCRCPTI